MMAPAASRLAELRRVVGDIAPVVSAGAKRFVLFISASDGSRRADVFSVVGTTSDSAWQQAESLLASRKDERQWLRVDYVDAVERSNWGALRARLKDIKRNYFRLGIALDADFNHGFLETEINANAMLYGGPKQASALLNERNFSLYAAKRHGIRDLKYPDQGMIWLFTTCGAFIGDDHIVHRLTGKGLDAGRRTLSTLGVDDVMGLIRNGSQYLASQVQENGRFIYGWHPCFDRPIQAYNSLRHASTLYAMLEAWEVTRDTGLKTAIDRGVACLTGELIKSLSLRDGQSAAFLVDTGDEIKLGGNAVAILALAKDRELSGDNRHAALLDGLAQGILHMQNAETGGFVHVLNYPALDVKQDFRTIYYDGEAAFGLMRLYEQTADPRWIAAVEKAFAYFIRAEHWTEHDHWLSYCVNELTKYRPEEKYFRFGLQNFKDYLTFVLERVTTFPTLLELMMASEKMIRRLQADDTLCHLLDAVDIPRFYKALHHRANYLLNGHFWPEMAMFFADPRKIAGSFFIRHHAFRVRIDDVEHYLSGLVAYRNFLLAEDPPDAKRPSDGRDSAVVRHWTRRDVERATGGHWVEPVASNWSATGLCIASQTMHAGDMVAVRLVAGEVGVDESQLTRLPHPPAALIASRGGAKRLSDGNRLIVDNVSDAVLALGRYARAQMTGKIFAITGSAGKTTAVAMLSHALRVYSAVGQTRHNANLPHGIAWNLASIAWDTPHTVLELAIGRMARNARLTQPDVAIFTNILPAHLQYHRDLATIAERKSAIFDGMRPGSIAVLNREMEHWDRVHMAAKMRGLAIVNYGVSADCDARLLDYDPASGAIGARLFGQNIDYSLGAAGRHMVLNSLAILAAVGAAGHDLAPAIAQLQSFTPISGRGKTCKLSFDGVQVIIVDDAYNANPGSMAASFAMLGDMHKGRRKLAVLGEMLELGPDSAAYHTALAPLIEAHGIDKAYAAGELYKGFWEVLPRERRGQWVSATIEFKKILLADLQDGDVLLLKGSHGSAMHDLVRWLKSAADKESALEKLKEDSADHRNLQHQGRN